MIDIFAWIVLLILVASGIAIFFIAGSLPGHIAKSRGHPWAQAVTVAGWVTLICGFALWPVALRRSRGHDPGDDGGLSIRTLTYGTLQRLYRLNGTKRSCRPSA